MNRIARGYSLGPRRPTKRTTILFKGGELCRAPWRGATICKELRHCSPYPRIVIGAVGLLLDFDLCGQFRFPRDTLPSGRLRGRVSAFLDERAR
jgi:hypothetical protein